MKKVLILMLALPLMVLTACEKDFAANSGFYPETGDGTVEDLSHGMMVLGKRLDNPYSTENMQEAYSSLYPTRSRDVIETTHLYVRFLPKDGDEYEQLSSTGIELFDYPLDYEILVDGDYYVDPQIPEGDITWQYAVVEKDFAFPSSIYYEVIEECCITESDAMTRAGGIDMDALEREAFRITGNEDMLAPATKAGKNIPQGRLTISDMNFNGGEKVGVAGVRVAANVFVKIARGYTDENGYFKVNKSFSSSKVRYRMVFKNQLGFAIGFNFILVPASVASLGKRPSSGIDLHFTFAGDPKTWRRSTVNNAMYQYWKGREGTEIPTPPSGLRIWLIDSMTDGYTLMLHQGAVWDNSFIAKRLPFVVSVLKIFSPDMLIGVKDCDSAFDLYADTYHEAAHASHYMKVGKTYWNKYAASLAYNAIIGVDRFGSGKNESDEYAGITEMWAYYYGSKLFNQRYGLNRVYGKDYWFKPQMLYDLDKAGVPSDAIFSLFTKELSTIDALEDSIVSELGEEYGKIFDKYFGNGGSGNGAGDSDGTDDGSDDGSDDGGSDGGSDDGSDDGGSDDNPDDGSDDDNQHKSDPDFPKFWR